MIIHLHLVFIIKYMRILFTILFLFISTLSFEAKKSFDSLVKKEIITSNKGLQQGFLYKEIGTYKNVFPDNTYVEIYAYIWKRPNRSGMYPDYKYEYVLTAISKSYNGTRITETWLYGNRIKFEGREISYNQFPNGLTTYVYTTPTAIYSWFTSAEHIGQFGMSWDNAIYENR